MRAVTNEATYTKHIPKLGIKQFCHTCSVTSFTVKHGSPVFRFSKQNMLMWGIWQGKGKPPFNVYFEPFASEMTHLYQQGTVNKVSLLVIIQGTNVCMIVVIGMNCINNCECVSKFNLFGLFVMQLILHANSNFK